MQKSNRTPLRNDGLPSWVWPLALVALVLAFFWRYFVTDQLLMSNDASLATLARAKAILPDGLLSGWEPVNWLGSAVNYPATPTWFLLYLMPVEAFARWIYVIHALAVSLLAFYWLRRLELSDFGAFFGSLVMTFAGSYLTYILPGHIGKFEMTTFAVLSFLCLTRALQTTHWRDFAWGGVALGLALDGAIDSGALMALLIAAWFLFAAGRRWLKVDDRTRRNWVLGFMLLVGLSAACALPIVGSFMRAGLVTNVPGSDEGDTGQQRWNWATQWSYPPAEVVDLFAPGYHGWKSHDPHSPYWGALGRNPEFDTGPMPADAVKAAVIKTNPQNSQLQSAPSMDVMNAVMRSNPGQVMQLLQVWNFRFNGDFHGTVTFVAILLAIAALFAREAAPADGAPRDDWRSEWRRRHVPEIVFWVVVAVVVLLTSFGRFFPPPFRFLNSLPLFSSMRNPNKLLVLLTPALAVLAAIGMDRLWRETQPPDAGRKARSGSR